MMSRFFHLGSFVLIAIFTPLALLILLSQNAVPGDIFYPIKRLLERGILIAASAHPTTRATFHTNLADRRFKEAESLLLARGDTSVLPEFVLSVSLAEEEIAFIKNKKTKEDFEKKLIASIVTYDAKLEQVKKERSTPAQQTPQALPPAQTQPPPVAIPSPFSPQQAPPSPLGRGGVSEVEEAIDDTRELLSDVRERLEERQRRQREEREEREERREERREEKKEEKEKRDRNRNNESN